MKITHILPAFTKGGAERVVVALANEAHDRGHEVRVVAAFRVDPTLMADALHPGIPLAYVVDGEASRYRRYAAILPWLRRNRDWLLEQDIVHCHLTFGAAMGTMLRRMRGSARRPKIVETFHAVGMPIPRAKRLLSAILARGRDAYVLMAEDGYWRRFRSSHPGLPVVVIPNGIAPPPPPPSPAEALDYRRSAGIPDDCPFVVGTVGRLLAERKPEAFPPVFARIAGRVGPEAHFLMAGEGEALEGVQALGEGLGLGGRVHFPGLVRRPELAFAAMDLYLSVNVGPITGIAALEAIGAGLPVLSIQALPDYDGERDWIWSSANPDRIAAEAIRLISSPEERRRVAEGQRAHLEAHYTAAAMTDAYERLYRSLLDGSGV